jgi:ABC-type glutathione transport system ATPase component
MSDVDARVACHFTDESRATAGVLHRQEVFLGHPTIGGDLLQVDDLAKDYRVRGVSGSRKRWLRAVEGVSFDIRSGESLGLVGESGSGKSTVARLLLGLTPRTRGTVVFEGRAEAARGPREGTTRARADGLHDPGDSLDPLMTIDQIAAEPPCCSTGARRDGTAAASRAARAGRAGGRLRSGGRSSRRAVPARGDRPSAATNPP